MFRQPSDRVSDFPLMRGVAPILAFCFTLVFSAAANAGFKSPYQDADRAVMVLSSDGEIEVGVQNSTSFFASCCEEISQDSRLVRSVVPSWSDAVSSLSLGSLENFIFTCDFRLSEDSHPEKPRDVPSREMIVAGVPTVGPQNNKYEGGRYSFCRLLSDSGSSGLACLADLPKRQSSALIRHLICGCATEMAGDSGCAFDDPFHTNTTLVSPLDTGVFSCLFSVGMSQRLGKTTGSLSMSRRDVVTVLCVPQAVCHVAGTAFLGFSSHLKGEWI